MDKAKLGINPECECVKRGLKKYCEDAVSFNGRIEINERDNIWSFQYPKVKDCQIRVNRMVEGLTNAFGD